VHHQVLVRHTYTKRQIDRAEMKRTEFRPGRYTSGSANLDDMVELGKAVILCDADTRKFSPKAARYRAHPDKNLRRVQGACDVCRQFGLSFLFLNERDAHAEHKKLERFKRAVEYGQLITG
jgi:hypothetical protein